MGMIMSQTIQIVQTTIDFIDTIINKIKYKNQVIKVDIPKKQNEQQWDLEEIQLKQAETSQFPMQVHLAAFGNILCCRIAKIYATWKILCCKFLTEI